MGSNSSSSTRRTVYGNTTTSNPYAYAHTDNSGTVSGFKNGTALNSVYNFVNKSIDSLLDEYLNPNLNSKTNQAKLNSFANTLNQQTRANLENNIINPLSNRNMVRSSQATDLYRNLSNQNISSVANFANDLIANSQGNTANMLSNLLNYYMLGANYLANMQNQSLNTSRGNATQFTNSSTSGSNASDVQQALLNAIITASLI